MIGEKYMTKQEIKKVVDEVNEYLSNKLWMDFEVVEYSKYELKIIGSLDISAMPNIEIILKDVFFASTVFEWETDTSQQVLFLIEGSDAKELNMRFRVEQGYHLIKFKAEDYPDPFGCIFGAKEILFQKL